MKTKNITINVIVILGFSILFSACSVTTATQVPVNKEEMNKNLKKKQEDIQKEETFKIKKEEKKEIIVEKEVIKTKIVYVTKYDKLIIGEYEKAYIPAINSILEARIDSGATTTSINALDIKGFERDGKRWVKCSLVDAKGNKYPKEYPVSRMVNIKRHGAKDQIRYVIKLRINISDSSQLIDVSLTDRTRFTYPVLIGRNFLNGVALVDVSKKLTKEPIKKAKK